MEDKVKQIIGEAKEQLKDKFVRAEEIALFNQKKVLDAFRNNKIALRHFSPTTGYGYGDEGRDTLGKVFADTFCAEDGIVSPSIASGTHGISLALFGLLRPGDNFVSISGEPYDTMQGNIKGVGNGSLADFNVKFTALKLKNDKFDFTAIKNYLESNNPKLVYIQRSRGYEWRDSFSIDEIGEACRKVRETGFKGCIFVDNCYGEFVEEREPTEVGADIVVGSLIKNPGGGIAPTGAYIVGREEYISQIRGRLTAPSIAGEVGSYAFGYQYFYQGWFLAPHVVLQSVKGNLLIGKVMSKLGFETSPYPGEYPRDITRSVKFGNEQKLVAFIRSVQKVSPIDSYVTLEAWDMPGYEDKVIMAAGCFVQGSSIELSADAPIRPPYIAYIQGGLTFEHVELFLSEALTELL